MSNIIKVYWDLFSIALNHLITSAEFCHWLTSNVERILVFIFWMMFLLSFPNSLLVGFKSLYLGLVRKSSLWSLIVTKHCRCAIEFVLSATSNFVASSFASLSRGKRRVLAQEGFQKKNFMKILFFPISKLVTF